MTDVHNAEARSRNMAAIRGKNTKPEMMVRQALFGRGYRFRLHQSELPGKPDLVLAKFRAAIQVQGCFWHRHDCKYFKWPATRAEFWREKIEGNVARDRRVLYLLKTDGWRVLIIWECALKKRSQREFEAQIDQVECWLHGRSEYCELPFQYDSADQG